MSATEDEMPRVTFIGACAHCNETFVSERHTTQEPKRFCSVKCRSAAYRQIPWVRHQLNFKRRARRRKAKDNLRRERFRELVEAMQEDGQP